MIKNNLSLMYWIVYLINLINILSNISRNLDL